MDYTQFIPAVLAVLGGSLQWMRQFKTVKDGWVYLAAFLLALGAYSVAHIYTSDWRLEILSGVVTVAGYVSTVLGGTFTASGIAKSGLGLVPTTNSK